MNAKGDPSSSPAGRSGSNSAMVLSALPVLFSLMMLPTAGQAAFPGANGQIAFSSNRDGNFEIYVMEPDGSGVTRLTSNPAVDLHGAWSADGTKIVFFSDRDEGTYYGDIYVMNADGSGVTRLTTTPGADNNPAWSPDGMRIVFTSYRADPNGEIYIMNADGSGQTRLTYSAGADDTAAWSPDGAKIAFHSSRDNDGELYVMNADGSGQTRLTSVPGSDINSNWSPDGSQIAFESDRTGDREVYVMNADGSGQTNRTNSPGYDGDPAWSPDGTKITFVSCRSGGIHEIYVMNADGSGQTNLTNQPAYDVRPDWQPLSIVPPNNPPVAVCKDAQVSADENCEATIAAGDVDGGSYDPDGDDITLSLDNTGPFPLGEHTVTLTVTDEHAESDSCQATVTVVDNTVPTPTLTDPICVTVGKGKKTANKLTAGASDNCTQSTTVTIDNVQVFNNGGNPVHGNGVYDIVGNDIYVYPNGNGWSVQVTLTATDEAGNGTTSTITKALLKCK